MKGIDSPLWYQINPDGTTEPLTDPTRMQSIEERRVGEDFVGDVRVSTVFLGLDHAHFGGPPVLFETMVFGGDHDLWCDRYHTIEQARRGHARVVEALRAGHEPAQDDEVHW